MKLTEAKQNILNDIVNDLKAVENVAAIVLGGSHSTGMANENSDLDIGIYYHVNTTFKIEDIERVARKYNIGEAPTVTGFYGWGAWVNGGAWINTSAGEIDFVYRNIEQVAATIEKCINGIWENDFEQQPPFGFSSVIYLAETYYCQPLYNPHNIITGLKQSVAAYPPQLKQTIIQQALWSARFTIWQAGKFAAKHDMFNTAGCFTRALKNIVEGLFAINELYSIGDKSAVKKLAMTDKCPHNLQQQIDGILTITSANELTNNINKLHNLFSEVVALAGDMYEDYFNL